jgi:hypothetical protein
MTLQHEKRRVPYKVVGADQVIGEEDLLESNAPRKYGALIKYPLNLDVDRHRQFTS